MRNQPTFPDAPRPLSSMAVAAKHQGVTIHLEGPFPLTPARSPRERETVGGAGSSARSRQNSQMAESYSLSFGERARVRGNPMSNCRDTDHGCAEVRPFPARRRQTALKSELRIPSTLRSAATEDGKLEGNPKVETRIAPSLNGPLARREGCSFDFTVPFIGIQHSAFFLLHSPVGGFVGALWEP